MRNDLERAIAERSIIEFTYSDKARLVEPHLLGYNQTNTLTLSGWLLGPAGGWRAFNISKIAGLVLTSDHFLEARPGYNPNDSTMNRIIARL
jgi:hypothetical protein